MSGQLKAGSMFSGYGGLDLAIEEVFGAQTVWQAEIEAAPAAILAHHWPGVPNLGDVTAVDWSTVEPIDVLAAGFPCQDVSAAGTQTGLKEGTRTGLWHEVVHAIDTLGPRWVVLENVAGLFSADGAEWPEELHALNDEAHRWGRIIDLINAKVTKADRKGRLTHEWSTRKHAERARALRHHKRALARFRRRRLELVPRAIATVLGTLASLGYDAKWTTLRASDIGAPHHRERVFIVAAPAAAGEHQWDFPRPADITVADADGDRRGESPQQPGPGAAQEPAALGGVAALPDGVVLPTPRVAATRTSRLAALRKDSRSAPSLDQAIEIAAGVLPREFTDSDDLPASWLPTPAESNPNDGENVENWLARRDRVRAKIRNGNGMGMPLSVAVRTLCAPAGDAIPAAAGGAEPMLPTPRASRGAATTETAYALGGRRVDDGRPQGEVVFPALFALPCEELAATPDGAADAPGVVVALPTPAAADSIRGSDWRRDKRPRSGGDDLVTATARVESDTTSQWGKFAAVIARWEHHLGRPAPSAVEPNNNGRPHLSAAFVEWMMGLPAGWVVGRLPGTGKADSRPAELRMLGNGVVPQQAAAALRMLLWTPMAAAA